MSRKGRGKIRKGVKADDGINVHIFKTDMSDELQKEAISIAKKAFAESKLEKDVALKIKKQMDATYPNTTWHCIVGNHFGSSISHQTKYLIFFQINGYSVLLFKSLE